MAHRDIEKAFLMGIELGFFVQFGVFTYVLSGISNRKNKELIKEKLSSISGILHYLSFESIEQMLLQMKTLNISLLKREFMKITVFHSQKFLSQIDDLQVDEEIKKNYEKMVHTFLEDLFEISEIDPSELEPSVDRSNLY